MSVVKDLEDLRRHCGKQDVEIKLHLETIERRNQEVSRKERLINTTLGFNAKHKKIIAELKATVAFLEETLKAHDIAINRTEMPHNVRRAAMEHAKALAMSTGTTQRVLL